MNISSFCLHGVTPLGGSAFVAKDARRLRERQAGATVHAN